MKYHSEYQPSKTSRRHNDYRSWDIYLQSTHFFFSVEVQKKKKIEKLLGAKIVSVLYQIVC